MLMVREEDLLSIWAQLAFIPFSGKPLRALIWGLVSESSLWKTDGLPRPGGGLGSELFFLRRPLFLGERKSDCRKSLSSHKYSWVTDSRKGVYLSDRNLEENDAGQCGGQGPGLPFCLSPPDDLARAAEPRCVHGLAGVGRSSVTEVCKRREGGCPALSSSPRIRKEIGSLTTENEGRKKVKSLSRVRLLATPWTEAYQAPQSMGFSRQGYWSGVPFPSPKMKAPLKRPHQPLSLQRERTRPRAFTAQPSLSVKRLFRRTPWKLAGVSLYVKPLHNSCQRGT